LGGAFHARGRRALGTLLGLSDGLFEVGHLRAGLLRFALGARCSLLGSR
jgi:hypothetical protein